MSKRKNGWGPNFEPISDRVTVKVETGADCLICKQFTPVGINSPRYVVCDRCRNAFLIMRDQVERSTGITYKEEIIQ